MHLHGHLKECISSYGPVYFFWLFSFERYNSILGNQPPNQRSVELQMMRYLKDGLMFARVLKVSEEEKALAEHLKKMQETCSRDALKDMTASELFDLCKAQSCIITVQDLIVSTASSALYMKKVLWDLSPFDDEYSSSEDESCEQQPPDDESNDHSKRTCPKKVEQLRVKF
ncbi:hypothetical protein EOD39_13275 [Acipenser ruthenus]|uniref:Uncharacterized protein n=1 Tax=Acipenser ruthenus TaxID=7906 RepID=A0A662YR41_ACIRT|nr:hypothetical protein EOD39_13275 [Acipenser ruthenus]